MVVWDHTARALMAAVVEELEVLVVLAAVLLPDLVAPASHRIYPVHR